MKYYYKGVNHTFLTRGLENFVDLSSVVLSANDTDTIKDLVTSRMIDPCVDWLIYNFKVVHYYDFKHDTFSVDTPLLINEKTNKYPLDWDPSKYGKYEISRYSVLKLMNGVYPNGYTLLTNKVKTLSKIK